MVLSLFNATVLLSLTTSPLFVFHSVNLSEHHFPHIAPLSITPETEGHTSDQQTGLAVDSSDDGGVPKDVFRGAALVDSWDLAPVKAGVHGE